jgi:alpha-glucosidase (family GH31 glycosyl hydrolase)
VGQPICRPLVLEFPADVKLRQGHDARSHQVTSNDWMLGSSLLVCPVTQPHVVERDVYLPGDRPWFSWQTGNWYSPGDWVTLRNTPQEPAPVLLMRQGTGIPLLAAIAGHSTVSIAQSSGGGGRVVLVAPGSEAMAVQWYEDDGATPTAQATRWQVTVTLQCAGAAGPRAVDATAVCLMQGSVPFALPFDEVTVVGAQDLALVGAEAIDPKALVAAMWPKARVQAKVRLHLE